MGSEEGSSISPVQQIASQTVAKTLGRRTDVDACAALARQVDQLLEQAAAHLQIQGAALACRMGCNFCCHLQVMVLPHEAIALFRYLNSVMEPTVAERVRVRLREYASAAAQAPTAAQRTKRRPCAFLIEGGCAAYEVRPSACAAYHSLSRESCERSFTDESVSSSTVALQSLQIVTMELEEGLRSALSGQGLSAVPIELHAAVTALLDNPGLIARWRAGRPLPIPNLT